MHSYFKNSDYILIIMLLSATFEKAIMYEPVGLRDVRQRVGTGIMYDCNLGHQLHKNTAILCHKHLNVIIG
jgi:hypothetical protein